MNIERNPGSEKLSKRESRKEAARSGVMTGGVLTAGYFVGRGDEVTAALGVLAVLTAAAPELRNVGNTAVNEVRRKVGRGKTKGT